MILGLIKSTATPSFQLKNGLITTTGTYQPFPKLRLADLYEVVKTANAAETANVRTVTVTRAASTTYILGIKQNVAAGEGLGGTDLAQYPIKYTSGTGGASGREVVDGLVAKINACSGLRVTAAYASDTTFTVTTDAGCPIMNIVEGDPNLSVANTTPGVKAVGKGEDLIAEGIAGAETGKYYVTYRGKYRHDNGKIDDVVLYIESAQTADIADLDNILDDTGPTVSALPYIAKTAANTYP